LPALLALRGIPSLLGCDVAALVKAYRGGLRARRVGLERFATAHPKDQSGAAAHSALASRQTRRIIRPPYFA
jgi:hypothetical protein